MLTLWKAGVDWLHQTKIAMAHETTKATKRRRREEVEGGFAWSKIFVGRGIDVGPENDLLPVEGVIGFDQAQGNAEKLDEYFPSDHFDYLHASQCLEHMRDPRCAILRWIRIVKPKGYLVITVPDIGAFERLNYPSRWNPDHRSSWSTIYLGSSFPIHIFLPQFYLELEPLVECVLSRYVEVNYNWKEPHRDQTWPATGAETWNEFVLRKK